jgi:hypothetical protein
LLPLTLIDYATLPISPPLFLISPLCHVAAISFAFIFDIADFVSYALSIFCFDYSPDIRFSLLSFRRLRHAATLRHCAAALLLPTPRHAMPPLPLIFSHAMMLTPCRRHTPLRHFILLSPPLLLFFSIH